MSHISWVQTLVNASGKKSSKVFFLPKLLLSFTSTSPEACLDFRLKSGALVPTDNGIGFVFGLNFQFLLTPPVILIRLRTCQTTITQSAVNTPREATRTPAPERRGPNPRSCHHHHHRPIADPSR